MKYYDITQELFSSNVYPGDKAPRYSRISDMNDGAVCNITELEMNAHNGTHIDAPRHFVRDGITIDEIPLDTLIGECEVVTFDHDITPSDLEWLLKTGHSMSRILCRGGFSISSEAARLLGQYGVILIGTERQSIAPDGLTKQVHVDILSQGIIAAEGLVLRDVPDGRYTLFAAPLKLGGAEGSPCRAVLFTES